MFCIALYFSILHYTALQYMRVLEPFFNENFDESYSRLKNRTKEILAQQVRTSCHIRHYTLLPFYHSIIYHRNFFMSRIALLILL